MNQALNALSLAHKAGKIVTGEGVLKAIRSQKACLVLIASDASDNTKKRHQDKSNYYEIETLTCFDSEELSNAIGKSNRMVIAVMDSRFSKMIKEKIK